MAIAHFRAGGAHFLVGRFFGALDQATVRTKRLHGGKAMDVMHLIQNRQRQHVADTRDRFQTIQHSRIKLFGMLDDIVFKAVNLLMQMALTT